MKDGIVESCERGNWRFEDWKYGMVKWSYKCIFVSLLRVGLLVGALILPFNLCYSRLKPILNPFHINERVMNYLIILHYIILYYVMLYYVELYYIILFYVIFILYYFILYYIILC